MTLASGGQSRVDQAGRLAMAEGRGHHHDHLGALGPHAHFKRRRCKSERFGGGGPGSIANRQARVDALLGKVRNIGQERSPQNLFGLERARKVRSLVERTWATAVPRARPRTSAIARIRLVPRVGNWSASVAGKKDNTAPEASSASIEI